MIHKVLILEMVMEVCTNVPQAPTVVYVKPYWGGCPPTILQMINCLQNSSMPITNQAHIWFASHHMLLHKFQEPKPAFYVLTFRKCKKQQVTIDCFHQLRWLLVSYLYISQSKKYHLCAKLVGKIEMLSHMHQGKRMLAEVFLDLQSC